MAFLWAKDYPDLLLICRLFGLYEIDDPLHYTYTSLQGFIQDGPQCGLVALAMCLNLPPTKETVNDIFKEAQSNNFSNNGEIFSVDYMEALAKKFLPNKIEVYEGSLDDKRVTEFLLNDGLLLVPYDCDKNYSPCLKNGNKAHWAVISGIIETEDEIYVVAKQGKSLNIGIWTLRDLARSNEQLREFSPDRKNSDLVYILPEGGIDGSKGLCGRSLFIYPNKNLNS